MRRLFPLFVLSAALLASNLPAQTEPVVKTWKGGWFETNVASVWLDAWGWEPWGEPEQGHSAVLSLPGTTVIYATFKHPEPLLKSLTIDAEEPGTGLWMQAPVTGWPFLQAEDAVIGQNHKGWVAQAFGAMHITHDLVLGAGAGSDGKYSLTVGILSVGNNEIVGGSGTGQVDQSGAGNEIAGELVLGSATGGKGTYNNNAGWTTIGMDATVGYAGTGVLNQTLGGGTSIGRDLVLGREPGSSGEVSIMGLGAWTVGRHLIIGDAGTGTLSTGVPQTQEIGGGLVLGNRPGSRGILNLYAGGLNTKGQFIVGRAGFGKILHILGKATLNSDLVLGQESSGQGDWTSTGETDVPGNAIIGLAGKGSYAQNAGWNRISGNLVLGQAAGSSGTYSLSALGFLEVAGNLVVGGRGTGSFSVMNIDFDSFAVKVGGSIILAESPGSTGVFGTSVALITAPRMVINSGGSFENSGGGTISEFYFDTVEQNDGRFSSIDLNISAPITNANYVTHYTLSDGELNVTGLGPLPALAISDGGVLTQTGGHILGAGAMQSGGEINGAFEIRNKLLKSGGRLAGATRNLGVTAKPTEPQGFLQSAGRTEGTFDNQGDALIGGGVMDAVIQNSGRFVQTSGLVQGTLHNQGYVALSEGVMGAVVYNSGALLQLGGRMTNTLVSSGAFIYSAGEFVGDFIQASTEGLVFTNLFSVGGDFRNEGVMTLKPIPQRLEVLGPNGLENNGTFGLLGGDLYTAQTRVGTTRDASFGHGSGWHQVTGTLSLGSPLGNTRAVYAMADGDLSAGALDIRPGGVFTFADGRVAIRSVLDNNGVVVQTGGDVQTGETRIGPAAGSLFTQSAGTHRIAGALSLGGAANAGATNLLLGGQLSAAALELHSGGVFKYVNGTLSFDQVRQDGGLYQGLTVAIGNNQPIRNYFLTGGAVDALSVTVLPGGELSQSGGSLPNVQQNGGTIRGTLENIKGFTYAAGAFEGTLLNQGTVWLQAPFTAGNGWRNESPFELPEGMALTLNGRGLVNESAFTTAGTLKATEELLGQTTEGAIMLQRGGANLVQSNLVVGGQTSGSATYTLQGGRLIAENFFIQPGSGMTQEGGEAVPRAALSIRGTAEKTGRYELKDGGLFCPLLVLTNGGLFEHAGGTNSFLELQLAQGKFVNNYNLRGGACLVDLFNLEQGALSQSGGRLNLFSLSLPALGDQVQSFHQRGGVFQAEEVRQFGGWVDLDGLAVGPLHGTTNNVHTYVLGGKGLRAGSLDLNEGGRFTQYAASTLEVPFINQTGGSNFISTLKLGGLYGLPTTNLNVSGGTLDLDIFTLDVRGTFTQSNGVVHARQFNQTGGAFFGTFENIGTFNYSSGPFNGRLVNRGSVNWIGDLILTNGLENHASITVDYGQHLRLDGRGLDNQGTITLNWGGRIEGDGAVNVEANSGTFIWNSGIVNGGINVGPGGTLYIAGGQNKQSGGPIVNAGNAFWGDSAYYGNPNALFDNRGTLTLDGAGYFNSYYGIMTFNNSGLFRKTSGTFTEVNAVFNNSGRVEVLGGRLLLNNGGTDSGEFFADTNAMIAFAGDIHQFQAGARLTGPAGLFLVGDGPSYAALDVPEGTTLPVDGNLALHNLGALTGKGTVAVSGGRFEWSGGVIRCTVEVSPEPATLVINGANNKQISGALLNRGNGVWLDGNIYPEIGSRFENSGTFTIQCDRRVTRYYDILDLHNTGVLRKTDSTGQTDLSASLLNEGLVAADTGVLSFSAGGTNRGEFHVGTNAYIALDRGEFIFEPSARVSGPGWLLVRSQEAYASLGAPAGQEVALEGNFQLANGGLSSGGSLLVTNGTFLWDSGVIYPTLKIAPENGRLLLAYSGNKQLAPGARIENRGLIVWSGGNIYGDEEAVLRNEGIWQITGEAAFKSYYGYLAIENAGELIKTNSPGTCDVSAALNNTGLVRVDSGCLYLSGPVVQMTNYALTGGRWYSRSPGYIATESLRLFCNEADVTLAGPGTLFTGLSWLADNPGSLALLEGQQFATRTSLACFGSLRVDAASKLTVNGPFGLADTTTLDLEVGGPSAPIVVTELAQLAGKLVVRLAAGLNPQASNTFTLMQHGSISGQFQNAAHGHRIATADRTGSFRITYGATAVELSDFRPAVVDIDGDAIADDWARRFFGTTPLADGTGPQDKFGDQDGDGMTNYQEYLAGTNPTDSKSVLRLNLQSAESDALALEVSPAPDKIYRLWQSTNLAFWTECTNLAPLLTPSGALRWTLPAPLPPANDVRHFRLSVEE